MTQLIRQVKRFGYAFKGIGFMMRTQLNFNLHLVLAIMAIGVGFYLEIDRMEWVAVVTMIGLVLMAEAFNTAIEELANRVNKEFDPAIGLVKDIASGAVLLISMAALVVALLIYIPKI